MRVSYVEVLASRQRNVSAKEAQEFRIDRLPPTSVRSAIDVQYFSSYLPGVRKV